MDDTPRELPSNTHTCMFGQETKWAMPRETCRNVNARVALFAKLTEKWSFTPQNRARILVCTNAFGLNNYNNADIALTR